MKQNPKTTKKYLKIYPPIKFKQLSVIFILKNSKLTDSAKIYMTNIYMNVYVI